MEWNVVQETNKDEVWGNQVPCLRNFVSASTGKYLIPERDVVGKIRNAWYCGPSESGQGLNIT